MTFNDVYFVVKYVFDYLNLPNFQHALNNISTKQNNTNNPSATNSLVNNEIHVLEDIQRAFGSPFWTKDQLFVYNQLFGKFRALGDEGVNNTIANAEIMRSQQGNVANYIAQIISPINQLKSTANQYLLLLDPLKEGFEGNDIIGNEDGIIEIIFDNNVEITNFVNSKSQMESWYIIIRGYAQLLSITPEDFEIISMSKASPAKFKIKTKLEGAKLILDIVVALLFIEKEFIPTKNLIDITRTNNMVDQSIAHPYLEDLEKKYNKGIDDRINDLVDIEIKKHNEKHIVESGLKNDIKKGVEKQFNFIQNGGTVNIYINGEQDPKLLNQLNTLQGEIKFMKESQQKLIKLISDSSIIKNVDSKATENKGDTD